MNKSLSCLILCLLLSIVLTGCMRVKTLNMPFANVPAGLTLPEVRKAIVDGCLKKHWTVIQETDTQVVARIIVRGKHEATVVIAYNLSQYTIKYANSVNLHYQEKNGQERIHRNYNNWVHYLQQSIDSELRLAAVLKNKTQQGAPGAVPAPVTAPSATSAI